MRNLKLLFMGVLLSAFFSAIASVNAVTYVKDSDLTAETTAATGDTFIMYDTSAGNTVKVTLANIYASAANVGVATIVTTGALDTGTITSGFGAIDNGTSNITSGGIWSIDVDGTIIAAAGSATFGAGADAGIWFDGTDLEISTSTGVRFGVAASQNVKFWEIGTETMRIDHSTGTSDTALMLYNTADDALIRVTVGDNDSGGTGFRALRIPNL